MGTLLDLVVIDVGWEAAVEAAVGEALDAVVVDSTGTALEALAMLAGGAAGTDRASAVAGVVLALGGPHPPHAPAAAGTPVRHHVRSDDAAVDRLLDALVGGATCVGGAWRAALEAAVGSPGSVVVTREGDRFSTHGWRVGGRARGVTAAALDDARRQQREAVAGASEAAEVMSAAEARMQQASARQLEVAILLDELGRRLSAGGIERERAARWIADTTGALADARERLATAAAEREREAARVRELEELVPVLEAREAAEARRGAERAAAERRIQEQAAEVGAMRADLERRAAAIEGRRQFLTERQRAIEARLADLADQRVGAAARRARLERAAAALASLSEVVQRCDDELRSTAAELAGARRARAEADRAVRSALDSHRAERVATERRLEEIRDRATRAELERSEADLRREATVAALRAELDAEPEAAVGATAPELPVGVTPAARARELERELRLMGPINPLALEEFTALSERHEFLEAQLDDVRGARRELSKVIRAVDAEIMAVFSAAFADVAANFSALFETLFPGGQGSLRLTDPDDLLATGIEVEARPSGKNVRKLSLLSGGERSLTAMAFLFAVFRSRPSPFYVMDEVEAALDDVNLHRFLDLVAEFRREAQLIIVSHQKRTMEAADVLYGVTMAPGGSSRVVSERVVSVA